MDGQSEDIRPCMGFSLVRLRLPHLNLVNTEEPRKFREQDHQSHTSMPSLMASSSSDPPLSAQHHPLEQEFLARRLAIESKRLTGPKERSAPRVERRAGWERTEPRRDLWRQPRASSWLKHLVEHQNRSLRAIPKAIVAPPTSTSSSVRTPSSLAASSSGGMLFHDELPPRQAPGLTAERLPERLPNLHSVDEAAGPCDRRSNGARRRP